MTIKNIVIGKKPGSICMFYQLSEKKSQTSERPLYCSVADPGCLSLILDPEFCPSQIPDQKTATKERGEKNLLSCLFCGHKITN
jgi:hypothetical protein